MKWFIAALIQISFLAPARADLERALCASEPAVSADYYYVDYQGGPETTDDERFEGHADCGGVKIDGTLSYGRDTGNLYVMNGSIAAWKLVWVTEAK